MTADATLGAKHETRTPGFASTLVSEWIKLTSIRSTYIIVGLALVLSVGLTALVALATGSTYDDWNESDRASFDPVLFSIFGVIFAGILFTVLGVLAFSSEYSSGMIRLTFTATPNRGRVLFAKVAVVAAITWVAGSVTIVATYLVGQAVLGAFDMPTVSLGEADALRAVGMMALTSPYYPVIGLSLAILLRSTAAAITIAMALMFAPSIFGGLLPRWWQENVLAFNPASTVDALALGHIDDSALYLDVPVAAVATVVWIVAFLAVAHIVLNRRDA